MKELISQRNVRLVVGGVCLIVFPVVARASITTFASMDTALGTIYERVRNKGQLKELPDSMEKGNIYQDAYKVAAGNVAKDTMGTIEKVTDYINTTYAPGCTFTTADTTILLYQNKDIRHVLSDQLDVPAAIFQPDLFYDRFFTSCMALHACLDPKGDYKNKAGLVSCVEAASTAFYLTRQHVSNFTAMDQSTYGDNVYIDGNADNSSFDLLVDIEVLGDMLFEDNTPTPEIVFFDMPSVTPPPASASTNSATTSSADDPKLVHGTQAPFPSNTDTPSDTSATGDKTDTNDAADPALKKFLDATQEDVLDPILSDGPLALGNPCVLTGDAASQAGPSLPTAEDIVNQLDDIYTQLLIDQNNLLTTPVEDFYPNTDPLGSGANAGNPSTDARQCPLLSREKTCDQECGSRTDETVKKACYASCCDPQTVSCTDTCADKTNARDKELCSVKCCTQNCDVFDGSDKLICVSQCLCGEVVGPQNPLSEQIAKNIETEISQLLTQATNIILPGNSQLSLESLEEYIYILENGILQEIADTISWTTQMEDPRFTTRVFDMLNTKFSSYYTTGSFENLINTVVPIIENRGQGLFGDVLSVAHSVAKNIQVHTDGSISKEDWERFFSLLEPSLKKDLYQYLLQRTEQARQKVQSILFSPDTPAFSIEKLLYMVSDQTRNSLIDTIQKKLFPTFDGILSLEQIQQRIEPIKNIILSPSQVQKVQGIIDQIKTKQKKQDMATDRAPQFEYRVRFCRIPVEVQSIIPKKVFTVEGVLREIQIVLTALKESGQLMKSVKTKEMFETSMQNIKLADVLAFNFFFSLKPIFDIVPEAEVKQERAQNNSDREKNMRGIEGDLQIKSERNKYLMLYNAATHDTANGVATDYTTQMNSIQAMADKMSMQQVDNSGLTEVATAKLRANVGDEVADFIGNNNAFWQEVLNSLILTNDVAAMLRLKVEEAK